ncbi:hypothetical protein F5144DRAFT_171732 [Chaetomium tenue]|uniref:Uncharacterized protein n=1 Tax=Chaetomium tenue TaxID=1854479 RepID=A0ACB7PBL4_9PEZI|nr:hypothetical protein F5144DRAFT_171732 [Chaetomium globosum]
MSWVRMRSVHDGLLVMLLARLCESQKPAGLLGKFLFGSGQISKKSPLGHRRRDPVICVVGHRARVFRLAGQQRPWKRKRAQAARRCFRFFLLIPPGTSRKQHRPGGECEHRR